MSALKLALQNTVKSSWHFLFSHSGTALHSVEFKTEFPAAVSCRELTWTEPHLELRILSLPWLVKWKPHCDWRSVSQSVSKSWRRTPSGAHNQIFITVWQLRSCFYGAPSLTRGRVCLLYLLLVLASAVFPASDSNRDSRPYSAVLELRLLLSSPPTTRRVTVEVFDPASTECCYGYS
jgi:hypothetical protein